jgi:hypothetical protein
MVKGGNMKTPIEEITCNRCDKRSRSRDGQQLKAIGRGYIVCGLECQGKLPMLPSGQIQKVTPFPTNNGFWSHIEYVEPSVSAAISANRTRRLIDLYESNPEVYRKRE